MISSKGIPSHAQKSTKIRIESFNKEHCLYGVKSEARHFHALDLAHSRLTPDKIIVWENDAPFICNCNSCQPIENNLITTCTLGIALPFSEEYIDVPSFSKDVQCFPRSQIYCT